MKRNSVWVVEEKLKTDTEWLPSSECFGLENEGIATVDRLNKKYRHLEFRLRKYEASTGD